MAGWYVRRGDKVVGPLEVDKLKEFVAAGQLLPTDQLATDEAGPWTQANKTKLFAESKSVAAPPASVPEQAAIESSNVLVWVVGAIVTLAIVVIGGLLILGEREPQPVPAKSTAVDTPQPPAPQANPQPAPFEYRILKEEWNDGLRGKAVRVDAQVADDVAPTVTEADLESLAPTFMGKYEGHPFSVYFSTVTPLSQPWGFIIHNPHNTVGGALECAVNEHVFEFGPWYFPDRIDGNTKWHELVWLTLPKVNKIVNGATQYHWEVTERSANAVYFDSKTSLPGAMKDHMDLNPQTWEISTYDGDVPRFVRLVESSLNYLDHELSQNIVGKLNSVIGGQEYLNGDKTYWTWMIGRLEVTYLHHEASDSVTIMQTKP